MHAHQVTPPPPSQQSRESSEGNIEFAYQKEGVGWGRQARIQDFFKEGEGLETRWVCDEVNIFGENIFIHVINVLIYTHKNNQTFYVLYKCFFPFFSSVFHYIFSLVYKTQWWGCNTQNPFCVSDIEWQSIQDLSSYSYIVSSRSAPSLPLFFFENFPDGFYLI